MQRTQLRNYWPAAAAGGRGPEGAGGKAIAVRLARKCTK